MQIASSGDPSMKTALQSTNVIHYTTGPSSTSPATSGIRFEPIKQNSVDPLLEFRI